MTFQRILEFWFKENSKNWFAKSDEFDNAIKNEFQTIHIELNNGEHVEWEDEPQSLLAMVIVLDQFSRNMFRGDKRSFDSDIKARSLSKKAVQMGFDKKLTQIERVFLYLPFEHSENLVDQEESIRLYTILKNEDPKNAFFLDYANQHYQIIKRFHRFPHRNQILERISTIEEVEFLKEKGSSF